MRNGFFKRHLNNALSPWRYVRCAVRIALGIFCLVVLGLAVGTIYQAIFGNVDEKRYKPPGRLVDIGGRNLHIWCAGSGSPTVILDAGSGWGLGTWRHVQPKVAETTQVCSYDRAGYGWSDVGPSPRTATQISSDLHILLQKAGIPTPRVLVGHSLGGLYVQHYAATYPAEVSGMVLVESSHLDQFNAPLPRTLLLAMKGLGATGWARLLFRYGDSSMNAVYSSNKTYATSLEELAVVVNSADELRRAHLSLGSKPLLVLTAERNESDESWDRMQLDLLTRSTNSRRVVVPNSGHRIQNDRPDVIIAAIRDVVEKSRQP